MKNALLLFISVLLSFSVQSQSQPENPGFEDGWEDVSPSNTNLEPLDWSSIQSGIPESISQFAPQVLFQTDDAHSGNYGVRLKNAFVAIAGIVANGLITNGRVLTNFNPELSDVHTEVDDPRWNTPFASRPDSMVGFYKYNSEDGDNPVIQILLHSGTTGKIPDPSEVNYVAYNAYSLPATDVTQWTRFSFALDYLNENDPTYLLVNISAGNGTDAKTGSELWLDDLSFVYNSSSIDEFELESLVRVYAADQQITIDLTQVINSTSYKVSLFDLTGKMVQELTQRGGEIQRSEFLKPGLYLCSIIGNNGQALTRKIMVR